MTEKEQVTMENPNSSTANIRMNQTGSDHNKGQQIPAILQSSKPLIIHRSANTIIVKGVVDMFKSERVSYTSQTIRLSNLHTLEQGS